jgi:hypothetical protein
MRSSSNLGIVAVDPATSAVAAPAMPFSMLLSLPIY